MNQDTPSPTGPSTTTPEASVDKARERTLRPATPPQDREAVSGSRRSRAHQTAGADERDLIAQLEAEWPPLAAGALQPRLRAWATEEPALAGFATPQHLLRHLRTLRGRPRAEDAILAALVRQAQADPLAARVVLQALLPGLKALAGRILLEASEREEVWSALLAHCWERIRRYPIDRRPARIAANVLLDTLKKTTWELKRQRYLRDQETSETPPDRVAVVGVDRDVEQLLEQAIGAGALSAEEADLILRTRIDGHDLHALAHEVGVAYHTLTVRRLRAEKRLLVFLGYRAVTFGERKRPLSSARAVGPGLTGSADGGAVNHLNRRR